MYAVRKVHAIAGVLALAALGVVGAGTALAAGGNAGAASPSRADTATPIRHLVVIFDENVSFDHYFATYPYAANLPGETPFRALPFTPTVNGLYAEQTPAGPTGTLLTANPNGSNPVRLGPGDPMTCDQDHNYTHEQNAAVPHPEDGGTQGSRGEDVEIIPAGTAR